MIRRASYKSPLLADVRIAAQHARAPNQKASLRKLPLRAYLTGHDSPARERALDG